MTGPTPPPPPPAPGARPAKGDAPRPSSAKAPVPAKTKARIKTDPAAETAAHARANAKPRPIPTPAAAPTPASKPPAKPPVAGGKGGPPEAAKPQAPKVMKAVVAVDPLVGTTLGRVRLEARIGSGKTAVVYRGHHTALDRTVAVKVLTPEARAIPEVVEKFATEARAIAKIDNENVLKIYDVGQEGEQHFLVMELLDGEEILDVITREGRIEPTDALRIVRQAANGLAAAHAQGIIHRDVKPQNLVLLEDGTVKIVDFGLAARDDAGSQRVGTPHYMAPEVCDAGQSQPVSDVYSLGITLYHMLTGEPPYGGRQVKEILQAHIKGEPLHPERKVPGLAREIGDLVRTLTKRDALLRPAALDVVADLDRIGGQDLRKKETLKGRKSRSRGRASTATARSSMPLIVGGVVVAAIAIGVLAFSGGGKKDEPTPAKPPTGPGWPPATAIPDQAGVIVPKLETPQEKADREKREAEAARVKRERDAQEDLKGVESWIRAKWQTKSDDEAVLARYRAHVKTWKGTDVAKGVEDRIKQIAAGRMHPHPDRTYGDVDQVEAVRKQWTEALPAVEQLLAKHEYAKAQALVPAAVEDGGGSLGQELRFWKQVTEHLAQFQSLLASDSDKIPAASRSLTLASGPATLRRVVPNGELEVAEGAATRKIPWSEVPAADLYAWAKAAFGDTDTQHHLVCLAFAWAHRLADPYWGELLEVEGRDDKARFANDVEAYKRTWDDRNAPPK